MIKKEDMVMILHGLWTQKMLYSRAYEIAEKAFEDEAYKPLLVEIMESIREINEKMTASTNGKWPSFKD